jgi:SAM-dependent methyltransferase
MRLRPNFGAVARDFCRAPRCPILTDLVSVLGGLQWIHRGVWTAAFRTRLRLARAVLEHRYDAPPEFSRAVWAEDLGLPLSRWPDEDRQPYHPSPNGMIKRILQPREVSSEDVFIDFGCGVGRVVLEVGRRYPFKRVIGVDFVPELVDIARETAARNLDRLRCREIELVLEDVVDYQVPDDVTVTYLFDPFRGEVFDTLVAKLLQSVDRNPRRLRFIYGVPALAERLEATNRVRLVRHGRRFVRRWSPAHYIVMYEILPAGAE